MKRDSAHYDRDLTQVPRLALSYSWFQAIRAAGVTADRDTSDDRPPVGLATTAELLDELEATNRAAAVTLARRAVLLAEVDRRGPSEETLGLDVAGWLTQNLTHSRRAAKAEVARAHELAAEPVLINALAAGRVSVEQAVRIGRGMANLSDGVPSGVHDEVAGHLVDLAAEFGPDGLSRLVNHAVEVADPDAAEQADAAALERVERRHRRDRFAALRQDEEGAWWLAGKLPAVEGARLAAQLSALATSISSHTTDEMTWGQAMADALTTMSAHYASCGQAPTHGADRPRVTVTITFDALKGDLAAATLIDTDQPITPQQARRLACDADILPAVLDGRSVALDVGRKERLFDGALRQAILRRDRGCVFPGCDRPPADCELHHIRPWWEGGETKLSNAATLCEHHHHVVEPNPHAPPGSQWELFLDNHGLPCFRMPVDPRRPGQGRPLRQHHRFRTMTSCT